MTTETINVPDGRKLRVVHTCPWWCGQDDEHEEYGFKNHYSQEIKAGDEQVSVWLDTTDDGATIEVRVSVSAQGGTAMLDPEQAQDVVNGLQTAVDIANGSTVDEHPPDRDAAWMKRDELQERIDAASLAFRALGTEPVTNGPRLWLQIMQIVQVLDGLARPDAIVNGAALDAWASTSRHLETMRAGLAEIGAEPKYDPELFGQLMDIEDHRRGMASVNVLHPDLRR